MKLFQSPRLFAVPSGFWFGAFFAVTVLSTNGCEVQSQVTGPVAESVTRSVTGRTVPLSGEQHRQENAGPPTVPAVIPMAAERVFVSDDDYAGRIRQLESELKGLGFTILLEKPFVVIGDESAEMVQQRCEQTIRWAVDRLKADYFENDPDHIIEIWLFGTKESYEAGCERLTGSAPTTPFGFYSSTYKKLIMNIATGGGTLVHEIVHPFMATNFDRCPSWFNEGLASLYEQCRDKDGHINGSTNWRLRGLQLAIDGDRLPEFETLMGTTTREFYDDPSGTNYAQARYLCYYLQEIGQLNRFYHSFREAAEEDPTGVKTLKTILETEDLPEFQKSWEEWVMKLRF